MCLCGSFMFPTTDCCNDDKNLGLETGEYAFSEKNANLKWGGLYLNCIFIYPIENPTSFQVSWKVNQKMIKHLW